MPANVQYVTKAFIRDHPSDSPAVDQHRIGAHRGAMENAVDLGWLDPCQSADRLYAVDETQGRVRRRRGGLVDRHFALLKVCKHKVGEGTADINA